jgi:DNA-binding NarL/FixJ family response regulator
MGGRGQGRGLLTPRELKVFTLMCRGLVIKEMASELHVGLRAIKFHLANIYQKFGVSGRVEFHRKVGFLE